MGYGQLTDEARHEAQEQDPQNKGPVPFVHVVNEHHAQEQEDDGVTRRAEHLNEVFDRCVRLSGHVGEGVMSLNEAASNHTADRKVL